MSSNLPVTEMSCWGVGRKEAFTSWVRSFWEAFD